ncbi:hypothetical protein ACJ2A9_03870 [Anaerobacillus sp. MEB173]|uniref:hypothetical protein n=1 Tax=Anaerobacillus sp. MEB173 TaxID=3383345 RepID=UPI003F9012A6
MQAKNLQGSQEILCISTDKVYDWIVNEATFDIVEDDIDVAGLGLTADNIANVTCEVVGVEIEEVEGARVNRDVTINGTVITLQEVTLEKTIEFTVTVTLLDGTTITLPVPPAAPFAVTRFERVLLCAPEGTTIEGTATDVDCFVTAFDFDAVGDLLDVDLSVRICQDIRVIFPVVIEVEAEFCQPRDILPTVCPPVTRPPQCPELFPDNE